MRRIHPLWLTWLVVTAVLPASIATAVLMGNVYLTAYTFLHVAVFLGLPMAIFEVPVLRKTLEPNPELERLRDENKRLIDALTVDQIRDRARWKVRS